MITNLEQFKPIPVKQFIKIFPDNDMYFIIHFLTSTVDRTCTFPEKQIESIEAEYSLPMIYKILRCTCCLIKDWDEP